MPIEPWNYIAEYTQPSQGIIEHYLEKVKLLK